MAGGSGAMHRWTQKGGEMLAVESRQQVLLPPLERGCRGEGGMVTQRLGTATALLSTLGPLRPAGLSPLTSLLSAHLSWGRPGHGQTWQLHKPPWEQRWQLWVAGATRGSPCPGCCHQLGDSKDVPMATLSQASTAPCRPPRCFAGPKAGCDNPS